MLQRGRAAAETWVRREPLAVAAALLLGAGLGVVANHYVGPARYQATVGISFESGNSSQFSSMLSDIAAGSGLQLPAGDLPLAFQAYIIQSNPFLDSLLLNTTAERAAACGARPCTLLQAYASDARSRGDSLRRARLLLSTNMSVARDERSKIIEIGYTDPDSAVARRVLDTSLRELSDINESLVSQAADSRVTFLSAQLPFLRRALAQIQDSLVDFYRANRNFTNSPELQFREQQMRAAYDAQSRLLNSVREQIAASEVQARGGVEVVQAVMPVNVDPKPIRPLKFPAAALGALLLAVLRFSTYRRSEPT